MGPKPQDGYVDFPVTGTDEQTYPLARLTFRMSGEGTHPRTINGSFADVLAGRGPAGVSYHENQAPADELNLGDVVRTKDLEMRWITISRDGEEVGGTWYCA